MPWIPVASSRTPFHEAIAIKLYGSDSIHLALSLEGWAAMGRPAALQVFFEPDRCAVGLRPAAEALGYKVHVCDTYHKGAPDRAFINAARMLRRTVHRHGYEWPEQSVSLALRQDGDIWVTSIPQSDVDPGTTSPQLDAGTVRFQPATLALRMARANIGVSELATLTQLTSNAIYKLLDGQRPNPQARTLVLVARTLVLVARALAMTVEDFFTEAELTALSG